MASTAIKFGTDGWRGRIADDYTFNAVRRCTCGFSKYLLETEGNDKSIVVGYDKRFASEDFAAAAAEVLAAQGFKVLLTNGPTPTPVISYSIIAEGAAGAINITASHNPASDNGFKVRDRHGGAVAPQGLTQIEAAIPKNDTQIPYLPLKEGLASGQIKIFDPDPA